MKIKWAVDAKNPGVYVDLYGAETIIPVSLKTKDLPRRKPNHIIGKGFDDETDMSQKAI